MTNEPYIRFESAAMALVRKGQEIVWREPGIQLLVEPSLIGAPTFIQMHWKDQTVKWYRTTWLKSSEPHDFSVVGMLKYLHDTPTPTIKYERGEADISRIENLIRLIKTLSLPPLIEDHTGITLDGVHYTLTIGIGDIKTVYRWHTCPAEWENLETLADIVYDLDLS